MKKSYSLLITLFLTFSSGIFAQSVGINSSGAAPAADAMLEVLQTKTSGAVYGIYGKATGTATTNYGGYFSATGATNNYGLVVPDGNVGIGTTSPQKPLQVGGTIRGEIQIVGTNGSPPDVILDNTATASGHKYILYGGGAAAGNFDIYDLTEASYRLSINSSGNVGIGTTTPGSYKLYVNGSGYLNAGAWVYSSDSRLKDNIVYLSDRGVSAINIINKLKPATFDYKNGAKNEAGFIAQDVQQVLPHLVVPREDGMLGLKTEDFIPYLTKAIQEQQEEIEALKAQNAMLTEQVDALKQLKAEVESLKKTMQNNNLQASNNQ